MTDKKIKRQEKWVIQKYIGLFCLLTVGGYYGLNVCVPPKSICWNPNLQYDGIRRCGLWRWLSHEGGALISGISVLTRRDTRKLASFVSSDLWRHSKNMVICKPGRGFSAEPNHAGTLISDFQPPELWEINVCCLSLLVHVFVLQQPE